MSNISYIPNPQEILKLVLEKTTDAVVSVQIAALHALITLSQSYSLELLHLGVIQLITPVISTHVSPEQIYGSKQEQMLFHSLVSNCLYLLSNLASQHEYILDEISSSQVVLQCIQAVLTQTKDLALPALDLLNLCAEDNKTLSSVLVKQYSSQFFAILDSLDSETKIAAVGVMITALNETGNYEEIFKYALPAVLDMISIDIHGEFTTNVYGKLSDDNFKSQEHFWTAEAKAQQASLEILANLLTVEEQEEEQPRVLAYLNLDAVKNVAKAAAGVENKVFLALFNFSDLMISMIELQYSAFSCIQNFIVNTECLRDNVKELWVVFVEHFRRSIEYHEEESEFYENFINLSEILSKNMCALSKKYPQDIVIYIQPSKLQYIPFVLDTILQKTTEITVNLLGVLSVLGKDQITLEISENIVQCLIKSCSNDDIQVNTEALNVFFDVFCDETYDLVLQKTGVLNLMRSGVDSFRHKISVCEDYEVKEHAQEAYENLVEFIKYKAQHMPR